MFKKMLIISNRRGNHGCKTTTEIELLNVAYRKKIADLFRILMFKYNNLEDPFIEINYGYILYQDMVKVKVYMTKCNKDTLITKNFNEHFKQVQFTLTSNNPISTTAQNNLTKQFLIYFTFPFYTFIKIDALGNFMVFRKEPSIIPGKDEDLDTIIYNSTTSYNSLDLAIVNNLIQNVIYNKFKNGFEFIMYLSFLLEYYRSFKHNIIINSYKLNFQDFCKLYNILRNNLSTIPIK